MKTSSSLKASDLKIDKASLEKWFQEPIESVVPNSIGMGSTAGLVELKSGKRLFVKLGVTLPPDARDVYNLGRREYETLMGKGVVPESLKPRIRHHIYDEETQAFCMAMEVLDGFGDHAADPSKMQNDTLLDAILLLHQKGNPPESLPKLEGLGNFKLDKDWATLESLISEWDVSTPDYNFALVAASWNKALEILASAPKVLVHGDLHGDNIAWTKDGIILCDWQLACIGAGAYDLAYAASNIEDAKDRQAFTAKSLAAYAKGLERDEAELAREYAAAAVFGLGWMASLATAVKDALKTGTRHRTIYEKVLRGWLALVAELDVLKVLDAKKEK